MCCKVQQDTQQGAIKHHNVQQGVTWCKKVTQNAAKRNEVLQSATNF